MVGAIWLRLVVEYYFIARIGVKNRPRADSLKSTSPVMQGLDHSRRVSGKMRWCLAGPESSPS